MKETIRWFAYDVVWPAVIVLLFLWLSNMQLVVRLPYSEVICELEYVDVKNRTQYLLDTKIDSNTRIQPFHWPLYEWGTYISEIHCD